MVDQTIRRAVFAGFAAVSLAIAMGVFVSGALATTGADRVPNALSTQARALDAEQVMGYMTCAKCHPNEIAVWKQTPHFRTFEELHRRPEAKAIAQKLGVTSIKNEDRCVACHYTQKIESGSPTTVSGISCESCHGAAKKWIDLHYNYGGAGITRENETSEHRQQRIAESVAAGMNNPGNPYAMAQSCMQCHTVPDEELVNVGGHSSGSLDFEMVSWSQGLIRHRFLHGGGTVNAKNDQDSLALLLVSGMIADLEFSLRATGQSTTKADYGYTVAKRASRSAKRIAAVYKKTKLPVLRQIVEVYMDVRLAINNQQRLNAAADKIAVLGYQFASENTGSELSAISNYIPGEDRWLK